MAKDYPPDASEVEVTFIDGTIKTYPMSAGPTISQYLAQQAGETGILTMLNGSVTYNIPTGQIREYEIRRVAVKEGA